MPSWNITATDEPEAPPTLFGRILGGITGFWGWIVRILVVLFLLWLFFTGMALLSTETAEADTQITYDAIAEEDSDAVIQREDTNLWMYMMNFANSLNYLQGKEYDLGMEKSKEFGEAYFQPSDTIYVKELKFYGDTLKERTAEIVYELGVNKEVHLIFRNNHITKIMTRHEGFSEAGSFLRYLQWYSYGRFMKGYPRYTCEAAMENGERLGSFTTKKEQIYLQPFSKVVRVFRLLRRGDS